MLKNHIEKLNLPALKTSGCVGQLSSLQLEGLWLTEQISDDPQTKLTIPNQKKKYLLQDARLHPGPDEPPPCLYQSCLPFIER